MNSKVIHIIFLLCFFCGSFISCVPDEPRLSRSHRKVIDSLAQERNKIIRVDMDSICDIQFAEQIDRVTDSIVADRMGEIKRKIEEDAKKN